VDDRTLINYSRWFMKRAVNAKARITLTQAATRLNEFLATDAEAMSCLCNLRVACSTKMASLQDIHTLPATIGGGGRAGLVGLLEMITSLFPGCELKLRPVYDKYCEKLLRIELVAREEKDFVLPFQRTDRLQAAGTYALKK